MTAIADTLRTLREARGLTRADLAQQAGVTEKAIYYIERGETATPLPATLLAFARVFGVPPESLTGEPSAQPPLATPLARRLRELRQARGLTQRQLAEASGVNRATLQNLELSRVTRPWQHVIHALADALGVEPNDLTTDVFDPANPKPPKHGQTEIPIGGRLRELRAERGLSQETLASYAGLSRQGIQKIENGSIHVRLSTLQQLALALDVTVADLAPGVELPPEPPAPPAQVAPLPPAHPALTALAAAVRAYDPAAEVAIDESGPALACWMSNGQLCYFWSRHGWAHYLRSQGMEAPDDLPDLVNPQRQTPSAAQRDGLLAVMKG
jgi:transcriptional regulator with XRE-family HTH domain